MKISSSTMLSAFGLVVGLPFMMLNAPTVGVQACDHDNHDYPYPHDHENDPALLEKNLRDLQEGMEYDLFADDEEEDGNFTRCGSFATDADVWAGIETMTEYTNRRLASTVHDEGPIEIPVVIHRIKYLPNLPFGATDEQLVEQMQVLNDAFAPHFSFHLVNQTETFNATWFRFIDTYENKYLMDEMKTALHQGGPETLNIYFPRSRFVGFATFPKEIKTNPLLDGIVVTVPALPRGRNARYNLGMTAVHEVGHWLGLLHTFEGGCKEPNDYVKDTNPQASATEGCPEFRDSCIRPEPGKLKGSESKNRGSVSPFDNGGDPIHNYMDYSDDICLNEFTPGQIDRMLAHWHAFRRPRGSDNEGTL